VVVVVLVVGVVVVVVGVVVVVVVAVVVVVEVVVVVVEVVVEMEVLSPDCSPFNERPCAVSADVARSSVLNTPLAVHGCTPYTVGLGYNVMKGFCVVINECSYTEHNNVMVNSAELIGTTMSDAL